jgi:hypothetical protein
MTFSGNKGAMGKNHSLSGTYAPAAADLPAGDPSYAAWRESARGFLDPDNRVLDLDNQARTSTYAITREPGP